MEFLPLPHLSLRRKKDCENSPLIIKSVLIDKKLKFFLNYFQTLDATRDASLN